MLCDGQRRGRAPRPGKPTGPVQPAEISLREFQKGKIEKVFRRFRFAMTSPKIRMGDRDHFFAPKALRVIPWVRWRTT